MISGHPPFRFSVIIFLNIDQHNYFFFDFQVLFQDIVLLNMVSHPACWRAQPQCQWWGEGCQGKNRHLFWLYVLMTRNSDNRKAFVFMALSIGVFCAATQQLQQWNCGLWFCSAEVFSFFSKLTLPMSSLQALWGCDLPGDYSAFNFAATAIFVATD